MVYVQYSKLGCWFTHASPQRSPVILKKVLSGRHQLPAHPHYESYHIVSASPGGPDVNPEQTVHRPHAPQPPWSAVKLDRRTLEYWYRWTFSKVSCMEVAHRARFSASRLGTWNSSRSGHAAFAMTLLIVARAPLHNQSNHEMVV